MSKNYWSEVGKKLLSLGKTAVSLAAPVVLDYGITKAVEKACLIIEDRLKDFYKKTGINTAISFCINLIGVLLLVFKPFGIIASRILAYVFFLAAFVFWLIRTVIFIKKYGKTVKMVFKSVIQEKSLYKGIELFVLNNFPMISLGYAGISIAAEYVPLLKEVPKISELVCYLVKFFWKRLALFASIMVCYAAAVLCIKRFCRIILI